MPAARATGSVPGRSAGLLKAAVKQRVERES